MSPSTPPILRSKKYEHASLFAPENLLREARRQKDIPEGQVPSICLLDPDGDILDNLLSTNKAALNPYWACYHTKLYNVEYEGFQFGIVAMITPNKKPPFFILIERAWRDEGTSYHYLPPSDYSYINREILTLLEDTFSELTVPVNKGAAWTTDAPFRETAIAIEQAKSLGILAVEMEAAALYAFAQARQKAVVCFAHVTNQMGNVEVDFEKGASNGSRDALELIAATAKEFASANKPFNGEIP